MEYNADMVQIAGIFVNGASKFGSLTRIIHKGGNEEKINFICEELKRYFEEKTLFIDGKVNEDYIHPLADLLLFMAVNAEILKLETDQYSHFRGAMPNISLCLLANIVSKLNLYQPYAIALQKFSIIYIYDLLADLLPCMEKIDFEDVPKNIYFIVRSIAQKIMYTNIELEDLYHLDKIICLLPPILKNISGINSDHVNNLKSEFINRQLGYILNYLLDLLLFCENRNQYMAQLIDEIIQTTITIVKCISLNVYCYWAEIDEDCNENLQTFISSKSYSVIQKYEEVTSAKELVQMLGTFAVKPKSFSELLHQSDTTAHIKMINKCDANQEQWFKALLAKNVFQTADTKSCLKKWSNLCDANDLYRLLCFSVENNDSEFNQIVAQCARNVNLQELVIIVIRHFYNNGFLILENNENELRVQVSNYLKRSANSPSFTELLVLLLKNPSTVLYFLFLQCITNPFYLPHLREFFLMIKHILVINNLALNSALKCWNYCILDMDNLKSFHNLFQVLFDAKVFESEKFLMNVFFPKLQGLMNENRTNELLTLLRLFNSLHVIIRLGNDMKGIAQRKIILDLLRLRSSFTQFDVVRYEILKESIELIMRKLSITPNNNLLPASEDKVSDYYKRLLNGVKGASLLDTCLPDLDFENKTVASCSLLKLLPRCVIQEWISICRDIQRRTSQENMITALKDLMLLLSGLSTTQPTLNEPLLYCMNNFGQVMQCIIIPHLDETGQVYLTNALVELITSLPEAIKEIEGLKLTSLMTDRSLKALNGDKPFLNRMCMIKNVRVCQVIARRILMNS